MGFYKILLTLFLLCLFWIPNPVFALSEKHSVEVTASIPLTRLTLFGFTSPNSRVELTGQNLEAFVNSNHFGYFIFQDIIIPKNSSDLCLASFDHSHRHSNTICIPPPPPTNYNTTIGPIIIPPTLTLDKENIKPDETIIASGQTVPNSTVKIYFFQTDSNPLVFPKSIYAFSLPALTLLSDDLGNYSFNLPTIYSTKYRLFASTLFENEFNSPQSNTLIFTLPSFWFLIWQRYSFYIIILPIFIISLAAFIWLTIRYYHHPTYLPAIYNKTLSLPFLPFEDLRTLTGQG